MLKRGVLYIIQFYLALFALCQRDLHHFSRIPFSKSFNTLDYDGGIQNWGIAQDKRGLIYVANNFGLLEFDGESWRRYLVANTTRLRSVFIDADNCIFIGGQNQLGYFRPDESGTLRFHSLVHLIPSESRSFEDVWKIYQHEDKIFFNTVDKIFIYDGKQIKVCQPEKAFGFMFQVANRLFVFAHGQGLMEWKGNGFIHIKGTDQFTESPVVAMVPHFNNQLLVFQANGRIYELAAGAISPWTTPAAGFLQASLVNTVIKLNNSRIAIGTQNNGLVILEADGTPNLHLSKSKGLNNRTVLSLFEDQFNNLWVGLNNGITCIELGSPFSFIDEQVGLQGTGYGAALHANKLYLGTSNGLFYQLSNPDPLKKQNEHYELLPATSGQVYGIDQLGNDLILTHHNGAYKIADQSATCFYDKTGTWKFHRLPWQNYLIAGTYAGFELFHKEKDRLVYQHKLKGIDESSRVFEFENDSTLWMTHGYKGVYRISLSRDTFQIKGISFYGQDKGFPSNILINVFKIGNRLVFAAEHGIFEYDAGSDSFVHIPELERLLGAHNHVSEIATDNQGNIYYISTDGPGMLKRNNFGEYEKTDNIFKRINKYLSDDLENISIIDHQNILYGAKEGFIHYNPSMINVTDKPFFTMIRSINITLSHDSLIYYGGDSGPRQELRFSPDISSVRFEFAAPYFDGFEDLQYQYYLENFDSDWSDWSTNTMKEYTNLGDGSYVFHVRGRNIYGDISKEASYAFTIYPPWYRTRLAYFIYGMLLISVFGLSMFILDSRHKTERRKLYIRQKKELLQKDHQIIEVSKKSEQEITKLRNDKLKAEVDHKNRELATTTMHLINKNEFMLGLKEELTKVSKHKNGNSEQLRKIIKTIDKNLSDDTGWEQFTMHFDQVHGSFLKNLKSDHPNLTPQEIKLCAYLRMNMSSKEIAHLLNISVRGVEIGRYRLRKKLSIDRDQNLVDYMMEYS